MQLNTWRKQQACERCRQLKVRCEYKSLTSEVCVRCEKKNVKCVIPRRNEQRLQKNSVITHEEPRNVIYFEKLIREAEQSLKKINVSPLKRAIALGVYKVDEVEKYYAELKAMPCRFPLIPQLKLADSIMEVERTWPWLAIALVTVAAVNSPGKIMNDLWSCVSSLYLVEKESRNYRVATDRALALAQLCQYALHHEKDAAAMLLILHGKTDHALQLLARADNEVLTEIVVQSTIVAILPYTLAPRFISVNPLIIYYHSKVSHRDPNILNLDSQAQCNCLESSSECVALPMLEMALYYHKTLSSIEMASSYDELSSIVNAALNFMAVFRRSARAASEMYAVSRSSYNENFIFPHMSTFLAAQNNIIRSALLRCLLLCTSTQCPGTPFLTSIISHGVESCGQLVRMFSDLEDPIFPQSMVFHISMAVRLLQVLRLMAYATGCDIDVRSDCMLEVVLLKWEELMRRSSFLRSQYSHMFPPIDTSNLKIGQLDAESNTVSGSGATSPFDVFMFDEATKTVREKIHMSRNTLVETLLGIVMNAERVRDLDRPVNLSLTSALVVLFQFGQGGTNVL